MQDFDPVQAVERSELILDAGAWPNFHDAELHELKIWRGDVRPEAQVWRGPVIEACFELCALQHPYMVVLRFRDCEAIEMVDFNHQNALYDLQLSYQPRGYCRDGTPLTPYICVSFEAAFGVKLSFKCFAIEALERRRIWPEGAS